MKLPGLPRSDAIGPDIVDALTRRAAIGLAGAALAGCARTADPRRLTLWAMNVEGETAPLLLPPFEAATGIAVDVQALPWTAAHEKILTAYAGGSLPDVMMVANSWLAELAMLKAIAPVPADLGTGLLGSARAAATIDGRLRGVPWIVDTQVQFYRRDLLAAAGYAAPPTDWAAWKTMAHALKRRRPDDYAVLLLLDWPEQLMTLGGQQPEPMLRDRDTRGNFSTPGFRAALAFYTSLFDEKLAPPIVGTQLGSSVTAFKRGWFAILPSGVDFISDLAKRTGEIPRESWSVAEMPGANGPATGLLYGSSLAVASTARDPGRAWQLVRYLTAPPVQLRLHATSGDLPSRASAWTAPQLVNNPVAATFGGQLARGTAAPAVPEWARIVDEVQQIAERTVRGQFGIDEATRLMDARVDALLAKRRWLLDRGHGG